MKIFLPVHDYFLACTENFLAGSFSGECSLSQYNVICEAACDKNVPRTPMQVIWSWNAVFPARISRAVEQNEKKTKKSKQEKVHKNFSCIDGGKKYTFIKMPDFLHMGSLGPFQLIPKFLQVLWNVYFFPPMVKLTYLFTRKTFLYCEKKYLAMQEKIPKKWLEKISTQKYA